MNRLIVQLVINGQAVWQTFADDIPDDQCRRMTDAELKDIGKGAAGVLAGIVADQKVGEVSQFVARGQSAQTAVDDAIAKAAASAITKASASAPAGKKRRP